MHTVSRKQALKELEWVAGETGKFRYRQICDYARAYNLSKDDRTWLYKMLRGKNTTFLAMDPTAEIVEPKRWQDEGGLLYSGCSRVDYEAVYDEITRNCESLKPLVEKVRSIKPPQRSEREKLNRRIREGDESARDRLIEMYLRSALLIGLRWSKKLGVDLQDAIGDAFEGIVKAVRSYNPEKDQQFFRYFLLNVYDSVLEGQPAHNQSIGFKKHDLEKFHKTYSLLKKHGCFECDRLIRCDEAIRLVSEKLNCNEKECRIAILGAIEPLSLEAYLELAACNGCDGHCEEIREEEDDAPYFEKELSAYCVDPSTIVEDRLSGPGIGKLVQERLCKMTDKEKDILACHFGINGGRIYTLEEIGRRYGVTSEWIRQIEAKALQSLRRDRTWRIECLHYLQEIENNAELKKLQAGEICRKEVPSSTRLNQNEDMKPKKLQAGETAREEVPSSIQLNQKEDVKPKKPQAGEIRRKEKHSVKRFKRRRSLKLSDLVFRYRMKHCLTKRQMAKHCGVSELIIALLEQPLNMCCPNDEDLLRLFAYMEVSENVFMDVITHDKAFQGRNLTWMWEVLCERKLLDCYRQMNKLGKDFALAQIKMLSESKVF